jgi:hypothetical protein
MTKTIENPLGSQKNPIPIENWERLKELKDFYWVRINRRKELRVNSLYDPHVNYAVTVSRSKDRQYFYITFYSQDKFPEIDYREVKHRGSIIDEVKEIRSRLNFTDINIESWLTFDRI